MGYHIHENTVNTSETQPSDTRRSGDSENQPDRKTERRNFLPPVKRKELGEFTIFNIPGWQIVGRLMDVFLFLLLKIGMKNHLLIKVRRLR